MFISTVAWLPCVKVIHPKGLWKSCYLTQNLICERFFFNFWFFFLQIFHYKNDCTTKISCSVDGASAWDTIQLVCLFVWFNKYGKKISKEDHPIQSIQEKEKTKHYWSFSHDPATVVTDVLLAASSLSALFSWILAALYQDIVIIKGFTSSCLFNRFESI